MGARRKHICDLIPREALTERADQITLPEWTRVNGMSVFREPLGKKRARWRKRSQDAGTRESTSMFDRLKLVVNMAVGQLLRALRQRSD